MTTAEDTTTKMTEQTEDSENVNNADGTQIENDGQPTSDGEIVIVEEEKEDAEDEGEEVGKTDSSKESPEISSEEVEEGTKSTNSQNDDTLTDDKEGEVIVNNDVDNQTKMDDEKASVMADDDQIDTTDYGKHSDDDDEDGDAEPMINNAVALKSETDESNAGMDATIDTIDNTKSEVAVGEKEKIDKNEEMEVKKERPKNNSAETTTTVLDATPQKSNRVSGNKPTNPNESSNTKAIHNVGKKSPPSSSSSSSSPSKQTPSKIFNKFATWKSKADAVINSEVLKAARESIEEKSKEVQRAVKSNLTQPNGHTKPRSVMKTATTATATSTAEKPQQRADSSSINKAQQNKNNPKKVESDHVAKTNDETGGSSLDIDAFPLNTYVENDDQSKQSRLTLEEDDFSYDSRDVSRTGDSESDQSSIFVDNDDAFSHSTYSSDQSSVRIRSPRRTNQRSRHGGGVSPVAASSSPSRSSSAKSSTRSSSAKSSPKSSTLSSSLGGSGSFSQSDETPAVPRQLFNFEDVAKKRANSASASKGNNQEEVVNSVSKGRYMQNVSRPAILQHLQRKVRAPSPPTILESSSSSSLVTSNAQQSEHVEGAAKDKQTTRIRRYLGPQALEKFLSQLSPGEYLMYLGPGMLGVNLKQTFLKSHGVYVDFIVPGGNGMCFTLIF